MNTPRSLNHPKILIVFIFFCNFSLQKVKSDILFLDRGRMFKVSSQVSKKVFSLHDEIVKKMYDAIENLWIPIEKDVKHFE